MSHDIFETDELQVTAFVGHKGNHSVQIGLKSNHDYAQLTEDQAIELAYALINRCLCKPGYCATD